MRAVLLDKPCKASDLKICEVNKPTIKEGHVLVKIEAFGINRSEIYTRQGLSLSVELPRIIGIECVGTVEDSGDSSLKENQTVISMMGGLGRKFDGSYAEYTLIPENQVYPVDTNLDFETLAAIPEMYYTAYASLFNVLKLKEDDCLLIRGATSSVGLASIQLAKTIGCHVIATTRSKDKIDLLKKYDVDEVVIDNGRLNLSNKPNKILEIIGTVTLKDSLNNCVNGGIVCMTGILGGQWEFKSFLPMEDIPSGVYLTSFDSEIIDSNLIGKLLSFIDKKKIKPVISKVFPFAQIAKAHCYMESNTANGKIVVKI